MNTTTGKQTLPDNTDSTSGSERRRTGHVVHDERGAASVEWRDAPRNQKRESLTVDKSNAQAPRDERLRAGFDLLTVKNDDTFNPYDRSPDRGVNDPGHSGKRDLKKLSAWIKLMKEMEERKKSGEPEE